MKKYLVRLEDTELQFLEIDAHSRKDARKKVEDMLDDGILWAKVDMRISEGCPAVHSVELLT